VLELELIRCYNSKTYMAQKEKKEKLVHDPFKVKELSIKNFKG
jgi:hypothetical protein